MTLLDANLLLYAYDSSSPRHAAASQWLQERLSSPEPVWLAWVTVLAFLRISTNRRVFTRPLGLAEAVDLVDTWLERPNVGVLEASTTHWTGLRRVLEAGHARADLVTDAHLAALAMEHGLTLLSTDRDFRRFEGLLWRDPLG